MKIHVFLLSLNSHVYFLMKKKMSEPDEVFLWRKICLSWRKKNHVFREEKNICLSNKETLMSFVNYQMNWIFHECLSFSSRNEEILSFIIVIIQPQDYVFRITRNKCLSEEWSRKKNKNKKKCLSETPHVFRNITMNKSFIYFIIRSLHSSWWKMINFKSLSGEEISVFLPIMLCYLS